MTDSAHANQTNDSDDTRPVAQHCRQHDQHDQHERSVTDPGSGRGRWRTTAPIRVHDVKGRRSLWPPPAITPSTRTRSRSRSRSS